MILSANLSRRSTYENKAADPPKLLPMKLSKGLSIKSNLKPSTKPIHTPSPTLGPVEGASSFVAGGGHTHGKPNENKKIFDTSLLSSRSKKVTIKDFNPDADVSVGTIRTVRTKNE